MYLYVWFSYYCNISLLCWNLISKHTNPWLATCCTFLLPPHRKTTGTPMNHTVWRQKNLIQEIHFTTRASHVQPFLKMLPSLQYVHTRPDRRWRLLPAVHTYRDIIVLLVFSHESDHIQYGVERWGDVVIGPVHIMELCYPASFLQWDIRRDIFKRVEVECVGDILFIIRSLNFEMIWTHLSVMSLPGTWIWLCDFVYMCLWSITIRKIPSNNIAMLIKKRNLLLCMK